MRPTIHDLGYVIFHLGLGLLVCAAFGVPPHDYAAGGFLAALLAPYLEGILR